MLASERRYFYTVFRKRWSSPDGIFWITNDFLDATLFALAQMVPAISVGTFAET